jgi:hypothetical protein
MCKAPKVPQLNGGRGSHRADGPVALREYFWKKTYQALTKAGKSESPKGKVPFFFSSFLLEKEGLFFLLFFSSFSSSLFFFFFFGSGFLPEPVFRFFRKFSLFFFSFFLFPFFLLVRRPGAALVWVSYIFKNFSKTFRFCFFLPKIFPKRFGLVLFSKIFSFFLFLFLFPSFSFFPFSFFSSFLSFFFLFLFLSFSFFSFRWVGGVFERILLRT